MRRREVLTAMASLALLRPAEALPPSRRVILNATKPSPPFYTGQVATRSILPTGSFGVVETMCRSRHQAMANLASLKCIWPNWYPATTTGVETFAGGTVTITASIEYPSNTFTQVQFSGAASSVTSSIANIISDAITVSIPKGAFFFVRTYFVGTSQSLLTSASVPVANLSVGEAATFGVSGVVDQTMGGTVVDTSGNGSYMYCPCAIIGQINTPSVCIIGDSRALGLADSAAIGPYSYVGEEAKSIGVNFPFMTYANSGCTIQSWLTHNTQQKLLAAYVSHVFSNFGINDLQAGRTSAQVQADQASAAALFQTQKFLVATAAPYTTSTDNWATLVNQTVQNAGNNAQRVAYNTALRAGVSWGSVIDIASVVESSINSGLWVVNGTQNYYVQDGLHETTNGNNLIAAANLMSTSVIHL